MSTDSWWWFTRVEAKINLLIRKVDTMAVDQATFDSDLAALVAAITTLIQAVDAWIASHPAGVDLTAEEASVQEASKAIADELAKITPAA